MKNNTFFVSVFFTFISCFLSFSQVTVSWRAESNSGYWYTSETGDNDKHWWYTNWSPGARNEPTVYDGTSTRHNLIFGNNAYTEMTVNYKWFEICTITFSSGATYNRTFNKYSETEDSGINIANRGITIGGIFNNSTATHTFKVPVGIGYGTDTNVMSVEFSAGSGALNFEKDIYINKHILKLSGSSNLNVSGIISGTNVSINKEGNGTATFTGANTYTGLTTVSSGTLVLNHTSGNTLEATNNVRIENTGRLLINQNQVLNNLEISAGTLEIAPGKTLTINGTLTYAGGTVSGDIIYGSNAKLIYTNTENDLSLTAASPVWPEQNSPQEVEINLSGANSKLSLTNDEYSLKNLTVTNGIFDLNGKRMEIQHSGTITNNGSILSEGSTVEFAGAGTIAGTNTTTLHNLTINGGLVLSAVPTITGTLQLNTGSYLNSPLNYAEGSTLCYNTPGYRRNYEWTTAATGPGFPHHVNINDSCTLSMSNTGNTAYCGGNITTATASVLDFSGMKTISIRGNLALNQVLDITEGKVIVEDNLILSDNGRLEIQAGAELEVMKNIYISKNNREASEIINRGKLETDPEGRLYIEVGFDYDDRWQFVSFPFPISSIIKKSNGEPAVYREDYEMRVYDIDNRLANKSGWKDVSSENIPATPPLPNGNESYIIWSDKSTLIFEAEANSCQNAFKANATLSLTYSEAELTCNSGWNFITHPISSSITAALSTGDKYYRYNYDADNYESTDYIEDTYIPSPASFESYFLQVTENRELAFTDLSTLKSPHTRQTVNTSIERVKLILQNENYDYSTLIRVIPEATSFYNALYNASHTMAMLQNTPQLYSFSEDIKCSINSVPEESTVNFGVRVPEAGEYTLSWNTELYNQQAVLYDKLENKTIDLSVYDNYTFTTTSKGEINERFSIIFSVDKYITTGIKNQDAAFEIYSSDNKIIIEGLEDTADIRLYDCTGRMFIQKTCTDKGAEISIPNAGIYLIQVESNGKVTTKKVIL